MARSVATNIRGRLSACCGPGSSHCSGLACSCGRDVAAGVFRAGPTESCSCLCSTPMAGRRRRDYKGLIINILFSILYCDFINVKPTCKVDRFLSGKRCTLNLT